MRSPAALLLAALACPAAVQAGESRCWHEAGVLVVPAEVMGVAGDYVLDTGAPQTLLAETQAQGAGFAELALSGDVRFAGAALQNRPIRVEKLDARFRGLPTPVAGVLGADVLAGRVLDISFAPCRITLSPQHRAPRLSYALRVPLSFSEGRPVVTAAVTDGRRAWSGAFVVATGSNTPVRLRDDLAAAPDAKVQEALYPYGGVGAKLRALSMAGEIFESQPSGLLAREGFAADGEIGAPVLSRFRLRFDFAGGWLWLAKEKGPPDRSDGP